MVFVVEFKRIAKLTFMNDLLERVTQGEVQVIMLSSQHGDVGLVGADGYEAGWHKPAKTMTMTMAMTMTKHGVDRRNLLSLSIRWAG